MIRPPTLPCPPPLQTAKDLEYDVYSFAELVELGAKSPAAAIPPSPEDLCTIMYTSGTTGGAVGGNVGVGCYVFLYFCLND